IVSCALFAQTPPRYEVDPTWPKPLPEDWTWGRLGGICVDSHDHVAVVDRRDISDEEAETSHRAPPIVIFDAAGTVIKSMGDPGNGDIYVADGYGNRRVAVFDKTGKFLRQWGRQATEQETRDGAPGAFAQLVHCIALGNDGLLYVCDRQGDRVQIFDKMGNFK